MRDVPAKLTIYRGGLYLAGMPSSMVPAYFETLLHESLGLEATSGQRRLFHAFTRFMFSHRERCTLLVKGYAGTGKTTSVRAMVRALAAAGRQTILLAPTGRAAKVLSSYTGMPAATIHRQIYERRTDRSGRSWFDLRENAGEKTVFIVDEASMIGSGGGRVNFGEDDFAETDLLEDLFRHIHSAPGCRLVLIGDSAQLPPIGSAESPALDLEGLRIRYDLTIAEVELDEVIRQKQDSCILENATRIRELIRSGSRELPRFSVSGCQDVIRVAGDVQPFIEEEVSRAGIDQVIILTRSNKRANLFNQQMRLRVLGHEEEINSGDRMLVLRNNYFWLEEQQGRSAGFIANGDILEIIRVRTFTERGPFRFCHAVIRLADYEDIPEMEVILLCTTIWEEAASLGQAKGRELFREIEQDYLDEPNVGKRRRAIYRDPYFNALQVKFAYALTVHKAQGGQWPGVFVDQGYLTDEMTGPELNRWMYTAITRASERLYLVGFEDRLISD